MWDLPRIPAPHDERENGETMNHVSRRKQIEEARASRSWPTEASPVYQHMQHGKLDPVVLGTAPAPIDDDEWANCCMLYWLMPTERKRQFWQLAGDRYEKQAFLLRHGKFEQARA